jgi:hypothetical protein
MSAANTGRRREDENMTTTTTNLTIASTNETAKAAVLNASVGLGALVWWSLTDTRIAPDRMRSILAGEGLDPAIVPDIDQASAIKRATREWTQGRGKAERFRAEIARTDGKVLTVGILRREQVSASEVRWVQVDTCTFDADNGGSWTAIGASPEAKAFAAAADEIRFHLDHQWIRPSILIRGLAAAQAVCLRDRGGVYYVPAQRQDDLARLGRVVAAIGRCHLDIVHAQATPESRTSIASGASAAIRDDLTDLLSRIQGWSESARKVSDDSAMTVLSDLAELKTKADLYADALQVSMDDLAAAIDEAKAEAERILTGVAVERTAAKPAPEGIVASLRAAIAEGETYADGSVMIAAQVLKNNGLKSNIDRPAGMHGYWTNGIGSRAAAALGFSARLRGAGVDAPLQLRPKLVAPVTEAVAAVQDAAQQVEPAPAEVEPAPAAVEPTQASAADEAVVVLDEAVAEDAAAEMRERLAMKTPAEIRSMYEAVVGAEPGKRSKTQMIDKIVSASI